MKRLGIYGGSFNPIHLGHLMVAQSALEEQDLDRIIFTPAAISPFKTNYSMLSGSIRLRLLRIALAGRCQYEVDPVEIQRGGMSYTVDTLEYFHAKFPDTELFYVIGADNVAQLPAWKSASTLAKLATFLVIPRPGIVETSPLPGAFQIKWLHGIVFDVSSSLIRKRVHTGLTIDHLVPPGVSEIIRVEQLFID